MVPGIASRLSRAPPTTIVIARPPGAGCGGGDLENLLASHDCFVSPSPRRSASQLRRETLARPSFRRYSR